MMCFSLGDIFGHTGKKSGDDSDFSIHPSDQCIDTSASMYQLAGLLATI